MRELTESELKDRYTAWQAKKKFTFTNPDGVYPDLHAFFNDGFTAGLEAQDARIAELERQLAIAKIEIEECHLQIHGRLALL